MLSKRSFGIAGAAMLGSVALLGTNAANAVINLDAASKADAAATFAEETVTATVSSTATGTFYQVTGTNAGTNDTLDIYGAIGVGATQDTEVEIAFELTNMVFGAQLTSESIEIYPAPAADATFDPASPGTGILLGAGESALISGGGPGSSSATFHVSNQDAAAIAQGDIVHLTVSSLGVVQGCGSISVSAMNTVSDVMSTSTYMDAVCVARGIREVVMPANPTTEVEREYVDFGLHAAMVDNSANAAVDDIAVNDARYSASLGSLQISVRHLNAADGTATTLSNVLSPNAFNDRSTADLRAAAARNASIQFVGMFDELEPAEVYLNSNMECAMRDSADDAPNLYTPPNPDQGVDNGKVRAVALNEILPDANAGDGATAMSEMRHVCVRVPEADDQSEGFMIPSTGKFQAVTSYIGIGGAVLTAAGMTSDLGRVVRDGVNVWLPYLTTDPRYNQRIIMVNDSASPASYRLDFTAESGLTVVAGTDSHGVLGADSTTVLNLTSDDVMSVMGGPPNRASAMLIIEAGPGDISVATNQTNRSTGGTDTVVYMEE